MIIDGHKLLELDKFEASLYLCEIYTERLTWKGESQKIPKKCNTAVNIIDGSELRVLQLNTRLLKLSDFIRDHYT